MGEIKTTRVNGELYIRLEDVRQLISSGKSKYSINKRYLNRHLDTIKEIADETVKPAKFYRCVQNAIFERWKVGFIYRAAEEQPEFPFALKLIHIFGEIIRITEWQPEFAIKGHYIFEPATEEEYNEQNKNNGKDN